ncbi:MULTISPECIES: tripartite tricarboxylate transporter permease [Roseicyclus]|jgi:TctA family transporter|uniref:tripartite tricarboxylate transporter permease n=1 Tax=Roseicyclus amphidinii TaxID=3034232 RepID=UPI0024E0F02B|nr:tripartite tricarboxylate transporter permease [Roseicyclus sp. Amp-Y-6]
MELFATAGPALLDALALIAQPQQFAFLVLGVLLGLSVGVFPGLGGIAGLSLVLPFIFGMDPVAGLALMVGLIAVVPTSDTFASVLLGIPGSTASQATVLDGFPLAKKGEAGRALSAAFVSSLFGGLLGAMVLTAFILVARPLILAFDIPAMLAITLLGLSMVAILAGRIPLKGVVAAGMGLLLGTVGLGGAGGSPRMSTYDMPYLLDGFSLVIVGLGIFAIPEIVALLRQDRAISKSGDLGRGWLDGLRDWWRNIWLSVKCSAIGVMVGVIPGLGGSVVDWIAYGFTVQSAKDKSQFGKGDIRGVIGPESSNNAKEGGGLVPTLIFGIPGSGSMAVFLGGLALLGYDPGPHMVRNNLDITYTIVWSLALANVVGAGLCIFLANPIARLTTIRFTLIAPFLFMVIAFAAFQSRQSLGDLAALMAVGMIGIFLRRFEFSRPAFLIGFVLSAQAEAFANQVYQIAGSRLRRGGMEGMLDYVASPLVLAILALTVLSIWIGIKQGKQVLGNDTPPTGTKRAPVAFMLAITAYVAVTVWDASTIRYTGDKVFPLTVGIATLIGCVVLLARMRVAPEGHALFADNEQGGEDAEAPHGLWSTLGWFAALLAMSALFGFVIALAIFLVAFFRLRAQVSWARTLVLSAAGIALICVLAGTLGRDFPPGLLQEVVDLPWPFT